MRTIVSAAAVFIAVLVAAPGTLSQHGVEDAPDGFELESNGFAEQFCANQDNLVDSPNSPQIPEDECNFDAALEEFTGPETVADGLGPIFNAAGCGECHIVPIIGGSSQIMERRAGRTVNGIFTDHPGGSLIQDRALFGFATQETVIQSFTNVVAFRSSLSILGNGFVEAVSNTTLQNIANAQPSSQRGQIINVPVLERPGTNRIGRFGHKGQQASLVSFSADAYLNEMGITSPLQPVENTSNGNAVIDPVPGENQNPPVFDDAGVDVELFALFMRSTKVPPRASNHRAPNVLDGEDAFDDIGCDVCHTPSMVTVGNNTLINGGALRVPSTLANKRIEPFSDFLLHDIGTGDGIVQNGGQSTRNKIRTPALWGLRVRGRFMHDASSFSLEDAIARHGGQASAARSAFNALSSGRRADLLAFLRSL
jgi:CxxC motif-containing protein (DUF1111 family)